MLGFYEKILVKNESFQNWKFRHSHMVDIRTGEKLAQYNL